MAWVMARTTPTYWAHSEKLMSMFMRQDFPQLSCIPYRMMKFMPAIKAKAATAAKAARTHRKQSGRLIPLFIFQVAVKANWDNVFQGPP